ncbi:MAG: arsenate reductase [Asticcacaulis sp.]
MKTSAPFVTLYGIKNCDTMKKAFDWLKAAGIAYHFHDYKVSGIDAETLRAWTRQIGWEKLLNRAGTTFKALPDEDRADLDEARALSLMQAQPSMIKRPVWDIDGRIFTGFKPGNPERQALEDALKPLAE